MSLFGTTPTAAVKPMFGSTTATSATPGPFGLNTGATSAPAAGLFGSTSTSTASPFGLNTGTSTAPAAGLFGSTSTSTASPFGLNTGTSTAPATGLFGSTSTSTAGGGLFGSTTTSTAPAGGGLFGSTATSTAPSTGLFGSTAPAAGGLFGSTSNAGLFGAKPAPFGASTTSTNLFGAKPAATGGLFGAPAQQQPTQMRDTLQTIFQNSNALSRSITSPQLFGDERDNIIRRLNQAAAAMGVAEGYWAEGQPPVKYALDGLLCRFVGVAYNSVSHYNDSDGMVSIVIRTPITDFASESQKQNLEDALFRFFGAKPEIKPHIEAYKVLPENCTEVTFYITQKGKGRITSIELCQYLNQNDQKNQLVQQMKVDPERIVSKCRMNQQQMIEYLRDLPLGLDQIIWNQAIKSNPDPENLIPVPVRGFDALTQRHENQFAEIAMQNKVLEALGQRSTRNEAAMSSAWARLEALRTKLQEVSFRLIRALCAQTEECRFAQPIDATEEQIGSVAESLLARLTAPGQVKDKMTSLLAELREMEARQKEIDAQPGTIGQKLTDEDLLTLKRYLSRCQDGLESLAQVAVNYKRDLNVMLKNRGH
ncbi:unnamed protein product, partial [Mesorhabditis spiculigera]